MLRLAVKRNRPSAIRSSETSKVRSSSTSDLPSYVICDSKAKGVVRHVSQGFQDLLGCTAQDCLDQQLLCPETLLQSNVLKMISKDGGPVRINGDPLGPLGVPVTGIGFVRQVPEMDGDQIPN